MKIWHIVKNIDHNSFYLVATFERPCFVENKNGTLLALLDISEWNLGQ